MPNLADAVRILAQQTQDASKPVQRVFGVVTKLDPLTIQVNEKLVLDEDFLAITQTVQNYINWNFLEVGDKVVMTRQAGGQLFILDDMLSCKKNFDKRVLLNHTHQYTDIYDGTTAKRDSEQGKRVE